MCRILIAAGKINSEELLQATIAMAKDETSTHEFNEANGPGSWQHDDGWGIAWIKDNDWQRFKSTTAIFNDPQVRSFSNLESEFIMIHVRRRMGSETAIENTHPFHMNRHDVGNFMFCHNGYAGEKFSFCPSFKLKGKTDSERLFYSILTEMKNHDIRCSIRNVFTNIETKTGSNVVLANTDKSFIALKENKYPVYYSMYIGRREGCVVISSEKLNKLEGFTWEKVSIGELISLDHRNLEIEKLKTTACQQKQIING